MTPTWDSETKVAFSPIPLPRKVLGLIRGGGLGVLVFGCLAVLLLVRLVERPIFKTNRPWTPWITVFVCRNAFRIIGIRFKSHGRPMTHPGGMVANHSSWLDIFALNAVRPLYFVSKAEVAAWPGIGWLARATGTVFVRRVRSEAAHQKAMFEQRFQNGHRLLFFPEGTSTDGQHVLQFKPTLFASFYGHATPSLWVQPVTVVYHAPKGKDPRFYGWWGDMDFAPHLFQVLAMTPQGRVELTWHDPIDVSKVADRKLLAKQAETTVRAAHSLADR